MVKGWIRASSPVRQGCQMHCSAPNLCLGNEGLFDINGIIEAVGDDEVSADAVASGFRRLRGGRPGSSSGRRVSSMRMSPACGVSESVATGRCQTKSEAVCRPSASTGISRRRMARRRAPGTSMVEVGVRSGECYRAQGHRQWFRNRRLDRARGASSGGKSVRNPKSEYRDTKQITK